jgi:hypothetical protein
MLESISETVDRMLEASAEGFPSVRTTKFIVLLIPYGSV